MYYFPLNVNISFPLVNPIPNYDITIDDYYLYATSNLRNSVQNCFAYNLTNGASKAITTIAGCPVSDNTYVWTSEIINDTRLVYAVSRTLISSISSTPLVIINNQYTQNVNTLTLWFCENSNYVFWLYQSNVILTCNKSTFTATTGVSLGNAGISTISIACDDIYFYMNLSNTLYLVPIQNINLSGNFFTSAVNSINYNGGYLYYDSTSNCIWALSSTSIQAIYSANNSISINYSINLSDLIPSVSFTVPCFCIDVNCIWYFSGTIIYQIPIIRYLNDYGVSCVKLKQVTNIIDVSKTTPGFTQNIYVMVSNGSTLSVANTVSGGAANTILTIPYRTQSDSIISDIRFF
jgi:hypothetical protein